VRRLLLFAAFLSLLGLSTAFAASFSVQSEDIASFTTDVSITVPPTPSTPQTLYLSGDDSTVPGLLATNPPEDTSINSRSIDQGTGSVQSQTNVLRYHSWETEPVRGSPWVLTGAVLRAFQNGSIAPMTVALFSCPPAATPDSTGCTQIGVDQSSAGTESAGTEVVVTFAFTSASIPVGDRLRLQVIDLTNNNWNIQWGYKSNRESRLDINVASP